MNQASVAFFIFNRPEPSRQVFESIREARPQKLYVVADGPRAGREGEAEKCLATRRGVLQLIDWPCEVHTNFAEKNLGCKWRMASGLDWVFSKEEQAIILEDDCVPDVSFFPFCDELLERYRDDQRVMTICGGNYQEGKVRTPDSYYFSKYPRIWGWASWRRAWEHYDVNMRLWPEIRDGRWLLDICGGKENAARYWHGIFEATYQNRIDTWDYQWLMAHWLNRGLTVIPNKNLISNIGWGKDATHTTTESDPCANLPLDTMSFPLLHPRFVVENYFQDIFTQQRDFKIQ